jgi:hypothetical protein
VTSVLVVVFVELWLLALARARCWRWSLLGAALTWSTLLFVLSEALSLVRALGRVPLFFAWVAVALALVWPLRKAFEAIREILRDLDPRRGRFDVYATSLLLVLGITFLVAIVAPPNTVDSLTYHMARVVAWLDQRSLAPFATHVERQVALGPFAETVIANLQALSGGDRFANLVQWAAFGLTAVAVSLLVQELGGDTRAQKLAAVLVATTPMAILQATSTQTDLVCSFFVVTTALYGVSMRGELGCALGLGVAAGLAMLTKGTAPVFLAPFAAWALVRLARGHGLRRTVAVAVLAGLCALSIDAPHWLRNRRVFGNALGPAWIARAVRNESGGPGATYSNLLRNSVSHIAIPDERVRKPLVGMVTFLHEIVGLDANDPRTTAYGVLAPPPLSTHEDSSGNFVLFVLFWAAGAVLLQRGPSRSRWFWVASLAGLVLYGTTFRWQPWGNRLQTPFFALAAAPVALALHTLIRGRLRKIVPLALVALSAPWLLANDTRSVVPTAYNHSMVRATDIWTKSRDQQYLAGAPEAYAPFMTLHDRLLTSGCKNIGVMGDEASLVYGLEVFIRRKIPGLHLRPVLVDNPTAKLARPGPASCALVSLAYGRIAEPEGSAFARFRPVWHEGSMALYLPGDASPP